MRIAGLVLAAGAGSRFGQPKAPVVVGGERLVDRAVRIIREAGADPVLVVLGAWQGDVPDATVVLNPDWGSGMGSSLRAGLTELLNVEAYADVDGVVVTLVDLPGLTCAAVRRLMLHPSSLAAASFDGSRGHPVKFAREHWGPVADQAIGDAGARAYLRDRDDVVLVEVGDVASGEDVDRPQDLPEVGSRA
ncbi:MAG: nucleotidyltransferase family protein [Actinomycetales bacterium]|nr:nucleotidyltransferase family protein [Actinomycetales bacterium]